MGTRTLKNVFVSLVASLIFVNSANAALVAASTGGMAVMLAIAAGLNAGFILPIGLATDQPAMAAFGAIMGLVTLDADKKVIVFSPITQADAHKIGLTEVELTSYNNELPLVNLVSDQMAKTIGDQKISQQDSKAIYDSLANKVGISAPTRKALEKIVVASFRK